MNPSYIHTLDLTDEGNKRQLKGYLIGTGSGAIAAAMPAMNMALETYNSTKSVGQAIFTGLTFIVVSSQFGGLTGAVLGDFLLKEKLKQGAGE